MQTTGTQRLECDTCGRTTYWCHCDTHPSGPPLEAQEWDGQPLSTLVAEMVRRGLREWGWTAADEITAVAGTRGIS